MKHKLTILLLLLSFATFAQLANDVTIEKWKLKPNTTKGQGRIVMDNPQGSVWTIYVYNQADKKYVTSFSHTNNKGIITVPPGVYKITLNNAVVENVPVKKGQDTELKTGLMEINHNELWYLYDESGETYYSSGLKPQKILMPVGNYQLKVGDVAHQMIVKERDLKKIETDAIQPWDFPKWTILPTDEASTGKGRLNIFIPSGDTTFVVNGQHYTFPIIVTANVRTVSGAVTLPKEYEPRTVDLWVNGYKIRKVPITAKNETRVKAGVLVIPKKCFNPVSEYEEAWQTISGQSPDCGRTWDWVLTRVDDPSDNAKITGTKGGAYLLPVGTYRLRYKYPGGYNALSISYTAVIRDGEWVRKGVKND